MHTYALVMEAAGGIPSERIELIANDASVAFGWAERNAQGRQFEIFEDGKSLGSASLSNGANFWILSPASGSGSAPQRRQRAERVGAIPLGE